MHQLLSNVALPSLFGHQFFMFAALLVVIAIESYIIARLIKVQYGQAFIPCSKANIISTLVGFPLGYFTSFAFFALTGFLLGLFFPDGNSKFVDAFEAVSSHSMMMGGIVGYHEQFAILAAIFMLIPYYYASVYIEKNSLRKSFPEIDKRQIDHTVIIMNRVTYGLLAFLVTVHSLTD